MATPLANITRQQLEPVWMNRNISSARIGAALGVSGAAIRLKAKSLGLPPRVTNQKKFVDNDLFTRMWLAGVCTTEIAKAFGYSDRSAVSRRRVILGLPKRERKAGAGRKNGEGRCGWGGTISLEQFYEMEVAHRMQAARKEAA